VLDTNFCEYCNYFHFFNAGEKGRITHFMDKQVQAYLGQECGLTIPNSLDYQVSGSHPVFDTFPCIIKPLESIHGGKKIKVCHSHQELNDGVTNYKKGEHVLIQQFIKKDYEIVVDGVSVNDDIIIPGYIRKFRDLLGGTTYSCTHHIKELPTRIVDSTKAIVRKIHYEGLFGVELIVSNSDYYFVEINLRNDATTYSLACAGVNLPYLYYLAKQGLDYSSKLSKLIPQIESMVEFRDFDYVLKRKISYFKWNKQRKHCKCLYFYDKDDILPYKKARKHYVLEKLSNKFTRFLK
jgi:carbamoylphosphate synthase large subunit